MGQKLLLADDSVTIQRVIELTFADEDVQVIAVGNGQEAIDRVQRDRPDIVLADVGMPERNGYEVAAFVKGNPATAHIPVLLLTGAFEPIDEGRARSVGCDGVLVKPFEPQIVISRVKDLLAGKKPSGMWGAGPVAQGPVRGGASDMQIPAASNAGGASADPLEAYFDRLDAAFASTGTGPASDPFGSVGPAAASSPASSDPFANVAPAPKREAIPLARRAEPAAQPQASGSKGGADPFADWDPDLAGDPARPAPRERVAVAQKPAAPPVPAPAPAQETIAVAKPAPAPPRVPAAAPSASPVAAPASPAASPSPVAASASRSAPSASVPDAASASSTPLPSLVEAFAALLAAEERIGLKPSISTPATPPSGEAPPITDEMIEEITTRVLARLSDESRPVILEVAERLVREEIERIKQG